ncbi:hypothetical protein [Pelagibius sp. 7325]|uniref:hypothetical protein n=1 Tax=Pelagibius sp. 7325 TaxID=3131994 RepID=UPI0030EE1E26
MAQLAPEKALADWFVARQEELGLSNLELTALAQKRLGRRFAKNIVSMIRTKGMAPSFSSGLGQAVMAALLARAGLPEREIGKYLTAGALLASLSRDEGRPGGAGALLKALAPQQSLDIWRLVHEIFVSGLYGPQPAGGAARPAQLAWVKAAAKDLVEIEGEIAREIIIDEEVGRLVARGRHKEALTRALGRYENWEAPLRAA